ncbi:MAG: flippase [Pseudomonadota bacterium]|nr:flippase [Pseudomonadota bacterium]
MTSQKHKELTQGKLLAKNTVISLIGQGAPMFIALVAIPILIKKMGLDQFGLLSLFWVVLGYFSLFDLGLGRVIVKLVSEKLGQNEIGEIPAIVWTALLLTLLVSIFGSLIIYLLAPFLVHDVFKIPEALEATSVRCFYLLAIGLPVVTMTAGIRGILEALQRFDITNVLQFFLGVFNYLGPLLVLPFTNNVFWIILVLLAGRFVTCLLTLISCFYVMPELATGARVNRVLMRRIIKFGSWLTVSNVISPIMVYLDRFIVGAMVSVTAVAYYSTPYEMVTRLWVIPGAMIQVLFPALSTCYHADRPRLVLLYGRGIKFTLLTIFPIVLLIIAFSHEGITLWLGAEFAQNSGNILQILALGVLFNSVARVPFSLIQSAERPDLTAIIHLVELPLYIIALWYFTKTHGLTGAALAWVLRMGLDMVLMFVFANRVLPLAKRESYNGLGFTLVITILCVLVALPQTLGLKIILSLVSIIGLSVVFWLVVLSSDEKLLFKRWLSRLQFNKAIEVESLSK